MVQLGKFIHFYGNVNSSGVKGLGAPNVDEQINPASRCFAKYTDATAIAALTLYGGTCTSALPGHPDMSFGAGEIDTTKRRMCEGVMLVTNVIDILENISLPEDSSMGELGDVTDSINTMKTLITTAVPSAATILNTTSQADCEVLMQNGAHFATMQQIFVVLFEKGLP